MKKIIIQGNEYIFRKIVKGSFVMGTENFLSNAAPSHRVTLTKSFWILETPVTQRLWEDVANTDIYEQARRKPTIDLYGVGDNYPMYYVNWYEVKQFMEIFTRLLSQQGEPYKADLPTEAQWEYACRAGSYSPYSWGDYLNGEQANCNGLYPYGMYKLGPFLEHSSPVKSFPPNKWGLYDMHGNVWEWCLDNYDPTYYTVSPEIDPKGPNDTQHKVIRGGGWHSFAWCCCSAFRDSDAPDYRGRTLGFRIVLTKI